VKIEEPLQVINQLFPFYLFEFLIFLNFFSLSLYSSSFNFFLYLFIPLFSIFFL